jgi:hypothetical protein
MATPQKIDAALWEVVEEDPAPTSPAPPERERIDVNLLALGLKTVSQRALAAVVNLFTLVTMAGTWFLWWKTPDPNPAQIVSLTIFAAFVLAANWLVRRK